MSPQQVGARHVWVFYPKEREELLRTVEQHADARVMLRFVACSVAVLCSWPTF